MYESVLDHNKDYGAWEKNDVLKTPMSRDVLGQYVCFNSPWISITCHRAWKQAFVLETTNSFTSKAHTPGLTFFSHSNSTLHHWQGTRASVEACCHICSTWGFFGFFALTAVWLSSIAFGFAESGLFFSLYPLKDLKQRTNFHLLYTTSSVFFSWLHYYLLLLAFSKSRSFPLSFPFCYP